MNGSPDVLEQVPAGGGMNKPASGTYGEKAELEALRAELPQGDAAVNAPPEPSMMPGAPAGAPVGGAPAGLPQGLLAPTNHPEVPGSTPLDGPAPDPFAGAIDARQRRLLYLDQIIQHPQASPEVKAWAEVVKQKLVDRG